MNDDQFFDRLREPAAALRYEPDDAATYGRLSARIADQLENRFDVMMYLAAWFRPVSALLIVAIIVCASIMTWNQSSAVDTIESVARVQMQEEELYSGFLQ
jgi:hypothetical protein